MKIHLETSSIWLGLSVLPRLRPILPCTSQYTVRVASQCTVRVASQCTVRVASQYTVWLSCYLTYRFTEHYQVKQRWATFWCNMPAVYAFATFYLTESQLNAPKLSNQLCCQSVHFGIPISLSAITIQAARAIPHARAVGRADVPNLVQSSTAQYSPVQSSTVQYSPVQYSPVQSSTVQYSPVQSSTVQYSLVQHEKSVILGESHEVQ